MTIEDTEAGFETAPYRATRAPAGDPLWPALAATFGSAATDLRKTLTANGNYAARPLAVIKRIVVHHSSGASNIAWASLARYHVESRKWPGIAYHLGIRQNGDIAYLGDIATHRWHAGPANSDSIGVCFAGTFTTAAPSDASIDALNRLQLVIESVLGRQLTRVGHRDVMQTACPGDALYRAAIANRPVRDPLRLALYAAGSARDLTLGNGDAALYKAIVAAGYLPVSPEFTVTVDDQPYTAQVARLFGQPGRIYYCPTGQWDRVTYVE